MGLGYIGIIPPKSVTVLFTCGTLTYVLKLQWLVKTYTPQIKFLATPLFVSGLTWFLQRQHVPVRSDLKHVGLCNLTVVSYREHLTTTSVLCCWLHRLLLVISIVVFFRF